MNDAIDAAWQALSRCLQQRGHDLQQEVRAYPTPIARCDLHLPQLIEERDAAYRLLGRAEELDRRRTAAGDSHWRAGLRQFAAGLRAGDDPLLDAARQRLLAALDL